MTSRHLVEPDLALVIDQLPSFDLTREGLPGIRSDLLAAMVQTPAGDDGIAMSERMIPGPAGAPDIRVYIYRPTAAEGVLPAILHIHAGGHILGSPLIADARNRDIARTANCTIMSVQYRLSPENPFPAALDDVDAALNWLHAHAAELNVDPARIALLGESAGGGLTASLAQKTRDRAAIPIVLQMLIYPMLDNRTGRTADRGNHSGEFMWTAKSNRFGWDAYLGEGHPIDDTPLYAVPGRCDQLAGLPPTFIAVGAIDLFAEEDVDYARRLIAAGVPTELHVYPGAYHGFDTVAGAWSADSLAEHQLAALRRGFWPATSAA